jgi:hypothetical protein
VRPQKQAGYAVATVTVPLGDLTSAQLRVLRDLAAAYSDGTLRMTHEQNLLFRWVPEASLQDLHRQLAAAGLGVAARGTIADPVSCPGAEACRLAGHAVARARALIHEHVAARPGLADDAATSTSRSAAARTAAASTTWPASASGQRAQARRPRRAAVLRDGRRRRHRRPGPLRAHRAPRCRRAAAAKRSSGWWASTRARASRRDGQGLLPRVEIPKVKALLADLEALTPENATPTDFQDLGEDEPSRSRRSKASAAPDAA